MRLLSFHKIFSSLNTGIIITSLLLFLSTSGFSLTPPDDIMKIFSRNYPEAKNVKWTNINDAQKPYLVKFKLKKQEMSISFSPDGKPVETMILILKKELPQFVYETLNAQFQEGNYKIKEAKEVIDDSGEKLYQLDLTTSGSRLLILVNKYGGFTYR